MTDPRPWVPAATLVATYLALATLPLLVAAAAGRAPLVRVVEHALLLATAIWAARYRDHDRGSARGGATESRRATRWLAVVAAWVPIVFVPPLYGELPHVAAGFGTAMHDAPVIRWEHLLFDRWFDGSPAATLAARWPSLALSEVLHAGYLSYYALIVGPPLLFFLTHRRRAFGLSMFGVMSAFVCCYVVFVLFPVQGPWFEWPMPEQLPRGPIRLAVERILHAGSSRGTAFPSSHVAISVAQTIVTWGAEPWAGVVCLVCTILLSIGAVYGGLHYGIDIVAGGCLGAVVGVAAPRLYDALTRRRAGA